ERFQALDPNFEQPEVAPGNAEKNISGFHGGDTIEKEIDSKDPIVPESERNPRGSGSDSGARKETDIVGPGG
ncbi:unnamed protein product, partial [marine sediment metagenome]